MFSEVVDEGWEKDVEGNSFETVDLLGLVLRERIFPQCFKCFCLSEGVGEEGRGGGGAGWCDIVLH